MKKLYMVLNLAAAMAASRSFATMTVTLLDNTSSATGYSKHFTGGVYGSSGVIGGEFRAVGNSALDKIINWNAYSTQTKGTISSATDGSSQGYSSSLNSQQYFQTFCLEYSEPFTPGTTYNVSISQNAMFGGNAPLGDPISIGTAWLYSQFAAGKLDDYTTPKYNYTYGSNRETESGLLQQAIWWLEGETGGVKTSFITLAEGILHLNDTTIKLNSNGAYGVYAMNLGTPGMVQDQLVIIVPEASTLIAGTILLLPFGTKAFRFFRRNRLPNE